ncbi:MAG TPA: META domain-containing protein [Alphaproteobacteria bacterium]
MLKPLRILCTFSILFATAACSSGVSSYADTPMGGTVPTATATQPAHSAATAITPAPATPVNSSGDYLCGDQRVTFTANDHTGDLQIANTAYAMQQVVAASGAKYENLGDSSTVFWSKGTNALLIVKGQDYPQCKQTAPVQKEKVQSPDGLREINWILEDINNTGVIDNSHITLKFTKEGRVYGNAGCNSYNGQYELDDQNLIIGTNMISTMMACVAPAMMEQENRYKTLLPQMKKVQLLKNGALVLMANDGRILRFMPEG